MTETPAAGLRGLPLERESPFAPPAKLAQLREERPLARMIYPDGHEGWLVTSYDLAKAVLGDLRFSNRNDLRHSPIPLPRAEAKASRTPPGLFSRMDPPDHTRYRRLLAPYFNVRRMRELEPRITEIVSRLLDRMAEQGPPVDLVEAFALPLPSRVICDLLGIPYEDHESFQRDSATLFDLTAEVGASSRAWGSLYDRLRRLVLTKRTAPADDLLGYLTTCDLTDDEVTFMGITLLVAGHETTANMLSLGVFTLLEHPDQLARLRTDPTLAEHAVEELMRHQTIIHAGPTRAALEDVELAGEVIKAGQVVTVSLVAANRDARRFPAPDTLDISSAAAHGQLGFGFGIHQCTGQQLARLEMRIALGELFRRFPSLRLAQPVREIRMRDDMSIYGVHRLPLTWDEDEEQTEAVRGRSASHGTTTHGKRSGDRT
ncbi:cytochrome P450 [Streptomyces sp. YS-3]|uniref:cytochrome P450 n=1 Tax=Streptomyces sp. YS-3 TaxID=3381352 RepID=UPI0038627513